MKECIKKRLVLAWAMLLLAGIALSCGGGQGSPEPDPEPRTEATELSGQITQDTAARVSSDAGSAVVGADVSLINPASGAVLVSTTTDSAGRYRFSDIGGGEHRLRLRFDGGSDMDGDGSRDNVEVMLPVTVRAEQETVFNATVRSLDLDEDGELDGFDIDSMTREELGSELRRLIRILVRLHLLLIDEDGDGDVIDDDPQDDSDSDGIPDDVQGGHNSLHGGVLRGAIEEISDDSITVDGISFEINDETKWKDKGNKDPDPDSFSVGTMVLIKGRWNGESWIAREIKTSGPRHDNNDDDEVVGTFHGTIELLSTGMLSIEGRRFELDASTRWLIEGVGEVSADLFEVGDFVMVEAREEDSGWRAVKVVLLSAGDDDGDPLIKTFRGEIELLSATALTVSGHNFEITSETEWFAEGGLLGDIGLFAIGDQVLVRARQEGEAWVALQVTHMEEGGLGGIL